MKKNIFKNRIRSFLAKFLVFGLLAGALPVGGGVAEVKADNRVSYFYYEENNGKIEKKEKTINTYEAVSSKDLSSLSGVRYYVLNTNKTFSDRVEISGNIDNV